MKMNSARCEFTSGARRDIERSLHFLRRRHGSLRARVRDVVNAVRFIQQHPKMRPVEGISTIGLKLRCFSAAQFVVVYSYFEPSSSDPGGLVSVRAIRHGREEDILYGVEESRVYLDRQRPSFLRLE